MNEALIIIFLSPVVLSHDDWSLTGSTGHGPDEWGSIYETCNGSRPDARQTPINVPKETVYNESLTDFHFVGYDNLTSDDLVILNNGYSGMVMLKPGSLGKAYFTGGSYSGTYYASRFHLHWGETNDHGSDHSVEGNFYAAALHFGHYNSKYSDILTSTNYPDGLAGLAIFFELAEDDNPDLEPYINALQDIPYKGNQTAFSTSFDKFFPDDMSKFYRYNGSMPLPPCNETVVWTLFKHLSTISSAQLDRLRTSLYDPDPSSNVASNNRPTQPLNGRTVERNFNDDDSSSSSSSSSEET